MIVWIDEDERNNFPAQLLLRSRGYELELVSNATDGLARLLATPSEELDLVLIDVMLLGGDDKELFSESATRNGVLTGLILAQALCDRAPETPWSKNTIIFSRASDPDIVREVETVSTNLSIRYFQKNGKLTATKFLLELEQLGYIKEFENR